MMSMKCKYAIKALVKLAAHYEGDCISATSIAQTENIPKKFLELILVDLKKAKLVNSTMGRSGGYYLLKSPADISVADVYRIFDGAISLLPCISLNFYEKCDDCTDEITCTMRREFIKIREGARIIMSKTSIESFL